MFVIWYYLSWASIILLAMSTENNNWWGQELLKKENPAAVVFQKHLTLAWFNELSYKRYDRYYPYLKQARIWKSSGEEVLEIGCGIGTDLLEYAKHGAIVTGMDLGEDQVMLTKLNFQLHGLPFKEIKQKMPRVCLFLTIVLIWWFPSGFCTILLILKKRFLEVFRVLKPDGTALILLYARGCIIWRGALSTAYIRQMVC